MILLNIRLSVCFVEKENFFYFNMSYGTGPILSQTKIDDFLAWNSYETGTFSVLVWYTYYMCPILYEGKKCLSILQNG